MNNITLKYPKTYLTVLNQIFEIENKLQKVQDQNSIQRNIERLKDLFLNEALSDGQGLSYYNPLGERYDERRVDCEASISGTSHDNLEIIEVLKPIIYAQVGNIKMVVQKAIVIVQSKN